MKRTVLILSGALFTVAGCHHQRSAPAATMSTPPGILVSQAHLVLPAVKGNPGAAYFTLGNESTAPATLTGVDIVGAQSTEMHQTSGRAMQPLAQLRVEPGQRAIFAPAGKHVMAFKLSPGLTPGGTTEIVLHFGDGKTTAAPLKIEAAGDAGGDMAGMNMGGKP